MYTLKELNNIPTISSAQADDLKINTGIRRIWLSRCSVEDGEPYPNKVTEEEWLLGRWVNVRTYEAK